MRIKMEMEEVLGKEEKCNTQSIIPIIIIIIIGMNIFHSQT
jgi:hypothetical protein